MPEEITCLIVDDHEVVREGLRALLKRRPQLAVVGEADSVASAVAEAKKTRPDVVIMDVRLPDGSGVEACRDIRADHPETRVIMLTSYADDEAVFASIMAGASGYLLKQTQGQTLVEAIGRVMRGESLLDPAVTQRVLERVRSAGSKKDDELSLLSEQEQKILDLISEGKTNKEIAAEVYLSDKTVKNYVSSILSKLNLRRRSEAAAFIAERKARRLD
jgi:DNA-binding NarL/FixJ family response regulator